MKLDENNSSIYLLLLYRVSVYPVFFASSTVKFIYSLTPGYFFSNNPLALIIFTLFNNSTEFGKYLFEGLEKVYVSPFYRALQTLTYSLESHPNKDKIIAVVHPFVSEITNCINDYILDIKQTKKDFNLNSIIKIDWSLFDEYIKSIKYDENNRRFFKKAKR